MNSEYDSIFKVRNHGASNIHGIRYQILYSIYCSFELLNEKNSIQSIQLEGLDDIDLEIKNIRTFKNFIQVKHSSKVWTASNLKSYKKKKGVLENFIEEYRVSPDSKFTLILSCELSDDILEISNYHRFDKKRKLTVRDKFRELCQSVKDSTEFEADSLLYNLEIISVNEDKLFEQISQLISTNFDINSDILKIYQHFFISSFFTWAQQRKIITQSDIRDIPFSIKESISREIDFEAFGKQYIEKVNWTENNDEDFFLGKNVRPGMIAHGLPVKRFKWLNNVEKSFTTNNTCIIRASSGQGKSTLLYQYVYDNWPNDCVYSLRLAETGEQVSSIISFLNARKNSHLPLFLIIDNAGYRTKLWAEVTQECSKLGFKVIISIRNDAWYNTTYESYSSFEIIEPKFALDEARLIFNFFQEKGQIHNLVGSPEYAYEKIGSDKFLIEYIYFITHGSLLFDRLSEQIRALSNNGDDKKIEFIRWVSLAEVFHVPLLISPMINALAIDIDPNSFLSSLYDEFITIQDDSVKGLHYIRSYNLCKILFKHYPSVETTAINMMSSVSEVHLTTFVLNCNLCNKINNETFIESLIYHFKSSEISTQIRILSGLFIFGEMLYFRANHSSFQIAFNKQGYGGIYGLLSTLLPGHPVDIITPYKKIHDFSESIQFIENLEKELKIEKRGKDLCYQYLIGLGKIINFSTIRKIQDIGLLLKWINFCNIKFENFEIIHKRILGEILIDDLSLYQFSMLSLGFYRYDIKKYEEWFLSNSPSILSYLMFNIDCCQRRCKYPQLRRYLFPSPFKV
ncbi:hypothetical protein, partial [Methanospirillum stamsii]